MFSRQLILAAPTFRSIIHVICIFAVYIVRFIFAVELSNYSTPFFEKTIFPPLNSLTSLSKVILYCI